MAAERSMLAPLEELRRALAKVLRAHPLDAALVRATLEPAIAEVAAVLQHQLNEARLGRLGQELGRLFAERSAPRDFAVAALRAISETMRAEKGYVVRFADDGGEATVLAEHPAPASAATAPTAPSRSFLAELAKSRETILVVDTRETPYHAETSVVDMNLRSVLATPLPLEGGASGAIYLENLSLARAFEESDRRFLEAIAQVLVPYLQVGSRLEGAEGERARLRAAIEGVPDHPDIIGRSAPVRELVQTIGRLGDSDAPVLIEGESGTGKELVARALHAASKRARGPLVAVNCAAIPENLMESELMGHERGAFTGATERKKGKLEQAHKGTLFLDEVGELRYDLQSKLLRVLQEQSFERVGGSETIQVDVRVVAATNRDLRKLVGEGKLREDLFYRLYVVPLRVPPLRERREDIPVLARHFLAEFLRTTGKPVVMDPSVFAVLEDYPFPGNVRELRNLILRLVALARDGRIGVPDLPDYVTGERTVSIEKDPLRRFLRTVPRSNEELKAARVAMQAILDGYVARLEGRFLEALLEQNQGNVSRAAEMAGMNRTLFHRKLKEAREGGDGA